MAAPVTIALVAVYSAVQQDLRQTANDRPTEIAIAAQAALNSGAGPANVVPQTKVDLATTLSPFTLVYGRQHDLLASSALLHGSTPQIPDGVLDAAQSNGTDAVTWQPDPGVREAIVAVPWNGGVLIAGQSLRLTEMHEDTLLHQIAIGWLLSMVALGGVAFIAVRFGHVAARRPAAGDEPAM